MSFNIPDNFLVDLRFYKFSAESLWFSSIPPNKCCDSTLQWAIKSSYNLAIRCCITYEVYK
jgi:hypothetical protein